MPEPDDLCPPFITRDSAQQKFQSDRLVFAIREIEWGGPFGIGYCPACGSGKVHGHASACPIGLALLPDQGVSALKEALSSSIQSVISHRHSLESLIAAAVRELDDLDSTLTNIQDLLHFL
jgi:hypothetical protein